MPIPSISISVCTEADEIYKNFTKHFEDKGFSVIRVKKQIPEEADYLILDFTNNHQGKDLKDLLAASKIKTVSIIDKNSEDFSAELLKLNNYGSVAIAENLTDYDYSDYLLKELFSFGHIGKSFVLPAGTSIKKTVEDKSEKESDINKALPKVEKKELTKQETKKDKKQFSFWNSTLKSSKKAYSILPTVNLKYPTIVLGLGIMIFSLSALAQMVSIGLLYSGGLSVFDNIDRSRKLLSISREVNEFSKYVSLGLIPHSRNYETVKISQNLFEDGLSVMMDSQVLADKALGDDIYNVTIPANNLSASLDKLYSDLGFFETQLKTEHGFIARRIKQKLIDENIEMGELRERIYNAKTLASRLDVLLGNDKPKKYLVLFQNNMELRPTGGFIGSFALITFEGGRLTEMNVSDVYSADGQLKGHVEPPAPIKDILGEANWYLRDSNWDPDFPETAARVEWFLEKETDLTVDGVVAVDLNLVKSLLEVTGELKLIDFDQTVNANNVYQKTQNEVEGSFFPGSIKKASFLTALSRTMLIELESLEDYQKPAVLQKFVKGLDEKHIQIYVHDNHSQQAIHELGFDGKLDFTKECGERCLNDKFMLVDANLGVNKANFFIERNLNLKLKVGQYTTNHTLMVDYTNSAKTTLGILGKYKSYTRLLLPVNANVTSLKINDATGSLNDLDFEEALVGDRKEIGFLLEVLPLGSRQVEIVWDSPSEKLNQGGEYRLNVYKQAGTESTPFNISFEKSDLKHTQTNLKPSLTGRTPSSYNTFLGKDLEIKSFFIK